MSAAWLEEMIQENTVTQRDYSEYLRLEQRRREIEDELKSIQKQQTYISSKIKTIWAKDGKKNHKFGHATFFVKNNLVVMPCIAVEDGEIVQALLDAGFDELVTQCVDYKGLRDLVRKLEGELPPELRGLLQVWCKQDLYLRIKKEKSE